MVDRRQSKPYSPGTPAQAISQKTLMTDVWVLNADAEKRLQVAAACQEEESRRYARLAVFILRRSHQTKMTPSAPCDSNQGFYNACGGDRRQPPIRQR